MTGSVSLTGFVELEADLAELEKLATRKAVGRRALKKAAEPMAEMMRAMAPRQDTGEVRLAASITVSTKLSDRQRKLHRKMFRDDRAAVEMFVGPGPDPAAWNQEFGNIVHGPQSFVRPAWDSDREALLKRLGQELRVEVDKAVARARRRAAKLAAAG